MVGRLDSQHRLNRDHGRTDIERGAGCGRYPLLLKRDQLFYSPEKELLRYRRAIGAEHVRVIADVKKKHSAHAITADVGIVETARAAEFFLADGVIVTGASTGLPADPAEVTEVSRAVAVPDTVSYF